MRGLVGTNGVEPYVITACQAPSDPSVVYAIAGLSPAAPFNGLFRSEDFGETWTRGAAVTATGASNASCDVDPKQPGIVYVFGVDGSDRNFVAKLWKSIDGGRTVQVVGGGHLGHYALALPPLAPATASPGFSKPVLACRTARSGPGPASTPMPAPSQNPRMRGFFGDNAPRSSSDTMYGALSWATMSWTARMFGWFSEPAARASCSKRRSA